MIVLLVLKTIMDVERSQSSSAYVYILCNDHLNVLYVGCTSNLNKRLYAHKKGLIRGFTAKYNVHRLVFFERYSSMAEACLEVPFTLVPLVLFI